MSGIALELFNVVDINPYSGDLLRRLLFIFSTALAVFGLGFSPNTLADSYSECIVKNLLEQRSLAPCDFRTVSGQVFQAYAQCKASLPQLDQNASADEILKLSQEIPQARNDGDAAATQALQSQAEQCQYSGSITVSDDGTHTELQLSY